MLAGLWNAVAKPVFHALGLKASMLIPSRLWWCSTGVWTAFPIHAAGIYGEDGADCVLDYVVSSYTPTVTALLDPPTQNADQFNMTAIIESNAPDFPRLPGARAELTKITDRIPNNWLTVVGGTGTARATVATSLLHLRHSSIVHFACHGVQDLTQPLDSGLILSDGCLKISEIMRKPESSTSESPPRIRSLAFLNACETAKGDFGSVNEAMHLAAGPLFAGFSGVVGTMWGMGDGDGPEIADAFYEHLFKDTDPAHNPPILPDLMKSAEALHAAVAKLRKIPGIPFARWVPFVHYGW
ncbi:CHAT domain-containing protein [Mycena capillaripes]|nr:CHAT domain-containing protein [Mycena capillaripes]